VILLGVFAAALVASVDYPLFDALGPGPGFFPFWLSLLGIILAGAMLVESTRGRLVADIGIELLPNRPAALKALGVLVAMTLAVVLLEPLGYRLTMLPFIAVLLPSLGARSVLAIAVTAAAGSFGVFHVFYYWLKVPLPIGALGI
jgi:putative tricarboxylic transport membrane protein